MLNKIAYNCITSATGLLALGLWVSDGAALTISECGDRGGFCDASNTCVRIGTGDMPTEDLGPCGSGPDEGGGGPGKDPATKLLVRFIGNTNCNALDSGLDLTRGTTNAPWLSVATGQTTEVAQAELDVVDPKFVTFQSNNSKKNKAGSATVQPSQATKTPQPLTVKGLKAGATVGLVQPLLNKEAVPRFTQNLSVAVYDKRTVPIAAKTRPEHLPKGCSQPNPNIPGDLMKQLNNIWDQAAIEFKVIQFNTAPKEVDFDLNNDCQLESGQGGLISAEERIVELVKNPRAAINIFYVQSLTPFDTPRGPRPTSAVTIPSLRLTFIKDEHSGSTTNVTAHELGHSLGLLANVNDDSTRLMFEAVAAVGNNPCFLNKAEWDITNTEAAKLVPSKK